MKIFNPYEGIDFKNALKVNSITHEHIYTEATWKSAYERGIRHFGALHYSPACPRFPASNYAYKLQNGTPVLNTYKDFRDIANADYTIVDTELKGSVDSFTSNGKVIRTDDLPQIPNNEHPTFTKKLGVTTSFLNHFNVLGNLWGEAGWGMGTTQQRKGHPISDLSDFENFFKPENQYWESKLLFTINHCTSVYEARQFIDIINGRCPIAVEVFNNGYSMGYQQEFQNCYDSLLQEGYKLFCLSVVDWQDYIEGDLIPKEEKYWEDQFNALTQEQKDLYGTWKNYYMAVGRKVTYDRGCNVLLVDASYNNLPANDFVKIDGLSYPNLHSSTYTQAECGMDAYMQGHFFASAFGNHSINEITIDDNSISFAVDGSPTEIFAISDSKKINGTGNSMRFYFQQGSKYVRFVAKYDNDEKKDFIATNPIWFEEETTNLQTQMLLLCL